MPNWALKRLTGHQMAPVVINLMCSLVLIVAGRFEFFWEQPLDKKFFFSVLKLQQYKLSCQEKLFPPVYIINVKNVSNPYA